jgi:hypothetical protein
MKTIEQLLETIEELNDLAAQALDLADEYSGGDSETGEELRERLELILDEHRKLN